MDARSFRDALDRVAALRRERKLGEALRVVEELLHEEPYSSELLVQRATLQQLDDGEHSLEGIESDLRTARLLSPSHLDAQLELGYFLYAVRDQPGEALQGFQVARRLATEALKAALIGEIKCHADLRAWDAVASLLAEAENHFPGDLDLSLLRAEHEPPATSESSSG